MKRFALPAVVLSGLLLVGLGSAYAQHTQTKPIKPRPRPAPIERWRPPPVQARFQMSLVDENASPLQTFMHDGRRFVLGSLGERYKIRLTNPTSSRVEAVVSVDGMDVLDGKTASLSKRGYVIPAFGSITVDGFRTSFDTVAAFRFASVRDSFAGRKGQDRNVGVIGVAFFKERVEPPVEIVQPMPRKRSQAADSSGGAKSNAPSTSESRGGAVPFRRERPGLGTEFGEQRESRVRETVFVRESESPTSTLELRYNDREGLQALGISIPSGPVEVDEDRRLRESAKPFPSPSDRRFAEPPP